VAASTAYTLDHAVDTYSTPSTISGSPSWPRRVSYSNTQAGFRSATLPSLISFSGEKCCSLLPLPTWRHSPSGTVEACEVESASRPQPATNEVAAQTSAT
jgi:hypothetical protein